MNKNRPPGGWAGETEAERRAAGYARLNVRLPPEQAARLARLRRGRPLVEVVALALEALERAESVGAKKA